jgi:transcription initiation factor TFIID subunit TAF12
MFVMSAMSKIMSTPTSSKVSARSESSSPAPLVLTGQRCHGHHKISSFESVSSDDAPTLQRDDVYERTMSWWRIGIRRRLVERVRAESEIIARMQVRRIFITINPSSFFLFVFLTRD